MAQDQTAATSAADGTQESAVTYIPVPADKAQAVINLVERLNREDEDVSGFMLSLGLFQGIAPAVETQRTPTVEHCRPTGGPGNQMLCDSDVIITEVPRA